MASSPKLEALVQYCEVVHKADLVADARIGAIATGGNRC